MVKPDIASLRGVVDPGCATTGVEWPAVVVVLFVCVFVGD